MIRYTEKTLSREGVSILTSHHVERVDRVGIQFPFILDPDYASLFVVGENVH